MAKNLKSDPPQEPGQPSSDTSGEGGDSQTSDAGQGQYVTIAQYDELKTRLDKISTDGQSFKDKRIPQLERQVGEQNEALTNLAKKLGVSDEDAQKAIREIQIDKLLAGESQQADPAQAADPTPVDPEPAHQHIMSSLSLESDDPDVVRIMRDQSGGDMYTSLTALSKERKAGVQPNAAQVALTPDKGVPQTSVENPIAEINDTKQLYQMEVDKMEAQMESNQRT